MYLPLGFVASPVSQTESPRLSSINHATATEPAEEEQIIRSKRRHHNLRVQVEHLDLTKPLDAEPLRKGMHAWLHSEEDQKNPEDLGMIWNDGK